MPQLSGKEGLFFLIGSGLLNAVVFTLIGMSLTFIAGFTLTPWHFPSAVLISLAVNYYAARFFLGPDSRATWIKSSWIILTVIAGSILFSLLFYDISFDGQMYHIDSAFYLKNGWNPFKKELSPDINQALWLNHYGKGAEAPEGAVYALTNRIETTKSVNFILLTASFCLSLFFLLRLNRFSFRKNLLFSFLLSCNPIVVYLLLTTYVDGLLASCLLCFLMAGCLLYRDVNRFYLMLLAMLLIVVLNIKFSSVVFAIIFSGGLLTALLISRQRKSFRKVFLVCALAAGFGVAVVGYFPYITNSLHYHDPLYPGLPMLQSEAAKLAPDRFAHMNRFSKFFVSFFSHTDDLHIYRDRNPQIPAKIPFSFNRTDIFNALKPIVSHMAGFGPFFSGISILALILFIVTAWWIPDKKRLVPVIVLLGTLTCSVFVISEVWYARYVPQLWFIPVIALIVSEYYQPRRLRKLRNILYLMALIDLSFSFASFPYVYYQSAKIDYELRQLKASRQTISVQFSYFVSNRIRFSEKQIPFQETKIPELQGVYMINSSTRYIPPEPMPDLPKSWILRMGEKIEHQIHP
ncbi:MAG: hypothetical protein Q8939_07725 [Bacteroidota bacterium]|nr:hypothetical protein [Bacteroidota bacterium]